MPRAEIAVRVQPRASRNEIGEERDGVLVVRVTAPPVDDAANEAVRALLAKRLGVAKGRILIARGQKGREKQLRIEGLALGELRRRLGI
jgi:uncharacterized protein (TIGR00251 family)